MPIKISAAIRKRAARIKLFLCDVDGVPTDSKVSREGCEVSEGGRFPSPPLRPSRDPIFGL